MADGKRFSRPVMGAWAQIEVHDDVGEFEIGELIAIGWNRFDEIDSVFSTYKSGSDISRMGRGELRIDECHPDVGVVLQLCASMQQASGGAFDIHKAASNSPAAELQRSDNPLARPLEPSGLVKGWAIGEVAELFWMYGLQNFYINVGGDVVASGFAKDGVPWRVGIRHPDSGEHLMAVVEVHNAAVATSGLYERGDHIVGVDGGRPTGLKSLTVVGPDIVLADAYATAAFAMGADGIDWLADQPEFSVLAADIDGNTRYDEGMSELITFV